jgi:hypothetical protein
MLHVIGIFCLPALLSLSGLLSPWQRARWSFAVRLFSLTVACIAAYELWRIGATLSSVSSIAVALPLWLRCLSWLSTMAALGVSLVLAVMMTISTTRARGAWRTKAIRVASIMSLVLILNSAFLLALVVVAE